MSKTVIQVILIIWFIVTNVFIFSSTYKVLKGIDDNDAVVLPKAPEPPAPPDLSSAPPTGTDPQVQQKLIEAHVNIYEKQVTAHNQQIDAYKKQIESLNKTRQIVVYDLVIKQTIVTLITGLSAALIAFAFAKAAELMEKHLNARAVNQRV